MRRRTISIADSLRFIFEAGQYTCLLRIYAIEGSTFRNKTPHMWLIAIEPNVIWFAA